MVRAEVFDQAEEIGIVFESAAVDLPDLIADRGVLVVGEVLGDHFVHYWQADLVGLAVERREHIRLVGLDVLQSEHGRRLIPGGHSATNAACRRMTPRNLTLSFITSTPTACLPDRIHHLLRFSSTSYVPSAEC